MIGFFWEVFGDGMRRDDSRKKSGANERFLERCFWEIWIVVKVLGEFVVCFAGSLKPNIYMSTSIKKLEYNLKSTRCIQTSCILPFPGRIGIYTPSVAVIVGTIRVGVPRFPSFFRFLDSCPSSTVDVTDSSGSESDHHLGYETEGTWWFLGPGSEKWCRYALVCVRVRKASECVAGERDYFGERGVNIYSM